MCLPPLVKLRLPPRPENSGRCRSHAAVAQEAPRCRRRLFFGGGAAFFPGAFGKSAARGKPASSSPVRQQAAWRLPPFRFIRYHIARGARAGNRRLYGIIRKLQGYPTILSRFQILQKILNMISYPLNID
jgi:hypothetical protein